MGDCQVDRKVKARKDHRCAECWNTIPKGTTYHKQTGIQDHEPYTWKVHSDCAELYWAINSGVSRYDECWTLTEFDIDEITRFRGRFPHAVCRLELTEQLSNNQ